MSTKQRARVVWFGISNGVTAAKKIALPYRVSALPRIFSSSMDSPVDAFAVSFGTHERYLEHKGM